MNKKVFNTKDDNGQELNLAVIKPSPKCQVQAQLEYNKNWALAEKNGSILRRNLDDLAEKHGLWSDDLRQKVANIEKEALELERKLRSGANNFSTVEDAKACALKIRSLRAERLDILRARNSLDSYTAESFADSFRLQYLVSQCTVYNDGNKASQPYFTSLDNYLLLAETKLAQDAFGAYLELLYDQPTDDADEFYENKWLRKYGFVDKDNRLINKAGHYISEDGLLINKEYKYVNADEELVDKYGVRVDDSGDYIIDYAEFSTKEVDEVPSEDLNLGGV